MINKDKNIFDNYDALFVDIWGVIHEGFDPYPNVVDSLNDLIKHGKKIIFLSNSPRPITKVKAKLTNLKINTEQSMIFTAGELVREKISQKNDGVFKNLGNNVYHLGDENDRDLLDNLNINIVDQLEMADYMITNYFTHEKKNINKFKDIFDKAKKFNLPLICANPDVIIANGDGLVYCSGYFSKQYEEIGGICYYYGKPYADIYHRAFEILQSVGLKNKEKILMIGDTLDTDIKGARDFGIDSLLVLTGNGKKSYQQINNGNLKPSFIVDSLSYLV